MAYFKNQTINRVYLHTALQGIAFYGGEFFAFVYLLKTGMSVTAVLLCVAALYATRMVIRMAVVPVIKHTGLRNGLIFGIVLQAGAFLVLAQVKGVGVALFAYLAMLAISGSFYWTTFHAFVAQHGDAEHRGTQVSATEFIGTVTGIVAPMVSGFLLSAFAPWVAFTLISLCMLLSGLPFIGMTNPAISADAIVPSAARREARMIMLSDGLRAAFFHYTWMLALFLTLNSSFAAFGGTLAGASLIGGIFGLVVGKSVDMGHGKRARQIGYTVMGIASLARAVGFPLVWSAIAANALAVIAWPMYSTVMNGRLYDLAKQSPCTLRYHVVAESGWDLGTSVGCLCAAALISAGAGFFWPLLLGVACTIFGYIVLERSFKPRQETRLAEPVA